MDGQGLCGLFARGGVERGRIGMGLHVQGRRHVTIAQGSLRTRALYQSMVKVRTVSFSKLGYARCNVLPSSDRQSIRKKVIDKRWFGE